MASRKGKATEAPGSRTGAGSSAAAAYLQELKETFRLFDTEHMGILSIKKLRLAMRTLGFEASIDDIEEIIQEMPSLSVHNKKKRRKPLKSKQSEEKDKGKQKKDSDRTTKATSKEDARRSSRAAAVASRTGTGTKSKYVDESDEDLESSDGDDDEADIYEGESKKKSYKKKMQAGHKQGGDDEIDVDEDQDDGELCFTLQDFITIMAPKEEEQGEDEVSRVFQLFDTQNRGSIRLEDLRRVASELGMPMKDEELREMIEEADRDGDGGVTEQEFGRIMKKTGF